MSYAQRSFEDNTRLLLTDPAALADHSVDTWNHLPRHEVEAMQRDGLRQRFAALRDRIPMLKKLADAEGVDRIDQFDDVAPLLFKHTVYKSYPAQLLEKRNFAQINKWLGKLVTPEVADAIAAVDVSHCQGLDAWFETMDREVPQIMLSHTSGTSGTLSFLPHGRREWEKAMSVRRLYVWNMAGPDTPPPDLHVAFPFFRSGFLSHLRANDYVIQVLLKDESRFHAAFPERLSSDLLHLSARIRAARANGTLDRLDISPEAMSRKDAFDRQQADMPRRLQAFFTSLVDEMKGKRVYLSTTCTNLHNMAKAGLAREQEHVFASDSYINTTGGAKGVVLPEGWREDILRFTGARRLNEGYAMSEVPASHLRCEHGHFHFAHTTIPFLLDPETGKPLPREGRMTGRAAFFDLGAETRWGGFVTGDEITVEWSRPCTCGNPSPYVVGTIQRYSEMQGGDDKITCAATEGSLREAMDFLNTFED